MEELKDNTTAGPKDPDGTFETRYGKTTFQVKVFFNHEGKTTAEDLLKRIIRKEALQKMAENIHVSP